MRFLRWTADVKGFCLAIFDGNPNWAQYRLIARWLTRRNGDISLCSSPGVENGLAESRLRSRRFVWVVIFGGRPDRGFTFVDPVFKCELINLETEDLEIRRRIAISFALTPTLKSSITHRRVLSSSCLAFPMRWKSVQICSYLLVLKWHQISMYHLQR